MSLCPVLLPGNMCDGRLWREDRAAIPAALAHRCGHDPVDADLTCDDTIAAMARRTLDRCPGMLVPVGFSMGAIVAMEMLVLAPQRIAGLVLIGYNASADLPERAANRPWHQAEARAGGLERILTEDLMPKYLAPGNRGDLPLHDLIRAMGLDLGRDVFVRQSEALRLRADRRAMLPRIEVPVLYACGNDDALCPPDWHRDWADATPGARLSILAGAGHMVPLEAPGALARIVDRWLEDEVLP